MNNKHQPEFGELIGVYHVRFTPGYFLPHLGLLLVAALGVGAFTGASSVVEKIAGTIFMILAVSPFIWVLWYTLRSFRDELTVYKDGFTYKSRKGIQSSTWKQIREESSEMDSNRRIKLTAVTKKNGERIVFGYGMRGRDLLDHELAEYRWNLIPESEKATAEDIAATPRTLGSLVGAFQVKTSKWQIVPIFLLGWLAALGVIAIFAVPDIVGKIVCPLVSISPLLIYVWMVISESGDEMWVYENGFRYRSRKRTDECLWEEIEDYALPTRGHLPDDLSSVKKLDGPWIQIASDMQGKELLAPHLRTLEAPWTGPED